jgi:ribosomal protein S27E
MSDWNSLDCPNCGAGGAIHTIYSESNHEINCQECDFIDRDDEVNCFDCGVIQ